MSRVPSRNSEVSLLMTLILGIDPSAAKIAAVSYETITMAQGVGSEKLYPKGTTKQTPESLAAALDFMSHLLASVAHVTHGDRLAYIEAPLVGRGGTAATIKQARVGGIIQGCLAAAGFKVYEVHPSTWRSALGIRAKGTKALKAATRQYVQAEWPKIIPVVGNDGDLTDAAAICLYGREQDRKASRIALAAGGAVQGEGSDVVVRPARLRRPVRRT